MFVDHGLEAERMERPVRTLVVGLGNPEATPDALGPKVLEHLQATRHLAVRIFPPFSVVAKTALKIPHVLPFTRYQDRSAP